ncbi:MAG: hypothetical protein J5871_01825 [Bacteroidales bacterium]|nr:hypothetical protein [Bacteroidales bacterium]
MRMKLTASLCAIAAILLVSATISVLEYSRMSSYVSDLIADDIASINAAQKLSDISNQYNLGILSVIGDNVQAQRPDYDESVFLSLCDSLRASLKSNAIMPLTDSVVYAYSAYMLTSLELENVLDSDFIDSRSWYFGRLQPSFERLRADIGALEQAIHRDLVKNSMTFERGFYRSVIPGIVAVGVGLLLVLMLLFFMLAYYVNPLYKMLDALRAYKTVNKRYTFRFEGDDQLHELNDGIAELAEDNMTLRKRLQALKSKQEQAA